nr:type II secretion system protein GspK [Bacteriovorax sp. HI3]
MTIRPGFLKATIKNERGIALMLVLGVIAILTFLLADFTFETKLNKIKIYNQQDKIQARLNAESGLNFAMGKLRLYQVGRNKLEKEESLKSAFPTSDLENIIIQPFIYPIPEPKGAGIIQKTALEEFNKKTLFRGEVSVTFTKIAGFLNPNGLRLKPTNNKSAQDQDAAAGGSGDLDGGDSDSGDSGSSDDGDGKKTKTERADVIIEKKLVETLQRLIKDKSDTDEEFHAKYSNVDPAYLVKELKFYVNDSSKFQDSQRPEVEAKFNQKNITPKHAPLASIDELYLLPSWDDAIVDLIKDRMSVHEVSVIAINELTIEDLKILFPSINNIQIEEFFKYRDGDEDKKIKGKKFKSAEDFKNVIVGTLNIVSDTDYNERMSELKQAGLTIDTAGKLYKVNSRGSYNNAVYNIVAYVDLPVKPQPAKQKKPNEPADPGGDGNPPAGDQGQGQGQGSGGGDKKDEKPQPVELLLPRVIEMRLE